MAQQRTSGSTRAGYRLAVFDFDGTLADSLPWLISVIDDVADQFGFAKLDREELESLRGLDGLAILRRLDLPLWKVPRIAAHMRELSTRERMPLFDGVDAALRELCARGVALAVVSSNGATTVQRALGDEVAASVGWYECGASMFGKSSKLKKVLASSGTAPRDAIYVGDELRDADAAERAGMPFGAVSWGFNALDALLAKRPAEVFARVDELPAKLAPR